MMEIVHRERLTLVTPVGSSNSYTDGFLIPLHPSHSFWTASSATGTLSWSRQDNRQSWVANMTPLFQQWVPESMSIEYVSTCSDSINQSGSVASSPKVSMAVVYDVLSQVLMYPTAMSNLQGFVQAKASQNIVFPINCDPRSWFVKRFATQMPLASALRAEPFNTVSGSTSSVGRWDLRYNFPGFVYLLIQNYGDNSTLKVNMGEIWINYHYKFYNPTIAMLGVQPTQVNSNTSMFHAYATTGISNGSGVPSNYFGSSQVFTEGGMSVALSATTITFPPYYTGMVHVEYTVVGGSVAQTLPTVTPSLGATAEKYYDNDTNSTIGINATSTRLIWCGVYQISGNGIDRPTLTFSGATLPTSATGMDLSLRETGGLMGLVDDS